MATVEIKSGDTAISFDGTLTQNGSAVDLTSATVKFLLKHRTSGTAYVLNAIVIDAEAGTVRYVPGVGFPTTAGTYNQEWEVTFADTTVLTFPSSGYNALIITDDLN